MLLPDGLGSIAMGRRKGVPYKPVLRRKLVGATLAVAHAAPPTASVRSPWDYKPVLRRKLLVQQPLQFVQGRERVPGRQRVRVDFAKSLDDCLASGIRVAFGAIGGFP